MAWCDVVEPRTLRACRIELGQSQAAFAAMLGVSPESYRTWDAGRRATPPKVLARARALATHQDDHKLLPLSVIVLCSTPFGDIDECTCQQRWISVPLHVLNAFRRH